MTENTPTNETEVEESKTPKFDILCKTVTEATDGSPREVCNYLMGTDDFELLYTMFDTTINVFKDKHGEIKRERRKTLQGNSPKAAKIEAGRAFKRMLNSMDSKITRTREMRERLKKIDAYRDKPTSEVNLRGYIAVIMQYNKQLNDVADFFDVSPFKSGAAPITGEVDGESPEGKEQEEATEA